MAGHLATCFFSLCLIGGIVEVHSDQDEMLSCQRRLAEARQAAGLAALAHEDLRDPMSARIHAKLQNCLMAISEVQALTRPTTTCPPGK